MIRMAPSTHPATLKAADKPAKSAHKTALHCLRIHKAAIAPIQALARRTYGHPKLDSCGKIGPGSKRRTVVSGSSKHSFPNKRAHIPSISIWVTSARLPRLIRYTVKGVFFTSASLRNRAVQIQYTAQAMIKYDERITNAYVILIGDFGDCIHRYRHTNNGLDRGAISATPKFLQWIDGCLFERLNQLNA